MSTTELLSLLSKATTVQKFDLVTALSNRKEKAVVVAVLEIANLPVLPDPDAELELRTLRSQAISTLGTLGDKNVIPFLNDKLGSTRVTEQMAAAYSLGKLGERSSVSSLIAHADRNNELLSLSIISALGDIGGEEALTYLKTIKMLDNKYMDAASRAIISISESAKKKLVAE